MLAESIDYKLPEKEKKSEYVESKFDEIAQRYDLFNDLITFGMHRYWKKFVAKKTGLAPGENCLDLCTGTGDIGRAVLKSHPEAKVKALDFSSEMLELAHQQQGENAHGLNYIRGDAMAPPFPKEYFEAVTVGYGLRNVADLSACIKNILSLLKPSGVLVCLDVGKVNIPVIAQLNRFYFFKIVPLIGKWLMPGQEMFDYLPHSSINYPDQKKLKKILLEEGFQKVDVYDFVFGASTIHVAQKPASS